MEYLDFVAGTVGDRRRSCRQSGRRTFLPRSVWRRMPMSVARISKGMRQKVALAGALVHDPRLILLDEPLTGLDAGSARLVKQVLRERVDAGCSVIMTTHILEVAERMADRIGVMVGGMLIAKGHWMIRAAGPGPVTPAWKTHFSRSSRKGPPLNDPARQHRLVRPA